MYNVHDFIRWAVSHAKGGEQPWQYLFGSVRVQTTQATLDYYYDHHYAKQMTRARYDELTRDWDRNGYATDCQGLCDAWWTYEENEKTDINADMNYRLWCEDKGKIADIGRPFVIGEAVFMANSAGKMTHVGWVCDFDGDEPLVVEARGIAYGVVITRLHSRPWTHRGLMTKVFDYEEKDMEFKVTSPYSRGDGYLKMQEALNAVGITDDNGDALETDGIWGRKSQQAFDKLIAQYAPEPDPRLEPVDVFEGNNKKYRLVLEYM